MVGKPEDRFSRDRVDAHFIPVSILCLNYNIATTSVQYEGHSKSSDPRVKSLYM